MHPFMRRVLMKCRPTEYSEDEDSPVTPDCDMFNNTTPMTQRLEEAAGNTYLRYPRPPILPQNLQTVGFFSKFSQRNQIES